MTKNLLKAYSSHEPGIHLIQAQTALGKTSAYIRLIAENTDKKFIVALPTNILKMQVYNDLLTKGGLNPNEIFVTTSIRDPTVLLPREIIDRVIHFHNCGLHNMQADIISEYYNQIKDAPHRTAEANQCIRLLSGIELLKDERVIVTTHAKFLQMPKDSLDEYTIIIDEDILYLQIMSHIRTISTETLMQLKNCKIKYFSAIAEKILSANEGEYIKLKPAPYATPLTEEQLKYYGLRYSEDNNINDLLLAGSAVIKRSGSSQTLSVQYFCPTKLPAAKYIVLSATLNEHLYREYFGQKLKITAYSQEKAQYKGKLIQFSYYTLGRNSLSRNMGVFDFARTLSGNPEIPIITFKMFEKQDLSDYNLHYGNATGINELEGQDLVVIGTPYKAEEIYKLFACYLKADIDFEKDKTPRPRRINYNGYNFLITTYEDALLREIQLHSLESELEQAIGRARLLRYDCTVWLFCGFPCEQAELHMEITCLGMMIPN